MAILGDFGEFEGPVPEPPYSYHHLTNVINNLKVQIDLMLLSTR